MKRILLFLATNLAVMLVLGVAARLLGVDRFLTANGLNLGALLGFALIMGFGGATISLLMSKSMAAEFAPDQVRVNCVNPVFNPDTALSSAFAGGEIDEARRAKFMATIPMGRFSTALDVAHACLYLASDDAAFVTGVNIEVDGGRCV